MQSFANIRKTKSNTVSLLVMFIISGILLNAGLLVFLNFGSFLDDLSKELNTSNVYYAMPEKVYSSEIDNYLKSNDNITEMQKENALWFSTSVKYKGEDRESSFILSDASVQRNLSKWKLVGESLPAEPMSIYLPTIYKMDGGYKLNDKFEIKLPETTLTFTIKGFTEDVLFSSNSTGIMGAYLPHDTYEAVSKELANTNYKATIVFANLKKADGGDIETRLRELNKFSPVSTRSSLTETLFSIDFKMVKLARTMMATMMSVSTVVFAVLIMAVCLIVIRFRIRNSIEDDMLKIGSLKSVGYTSGQIIATIALQFGLIAVTGSIIGIALSYAVTPTISSIFAEQSGLLWIQGFDPMISGITLGFILIIVAFAAFVSANRIKKLNPITALRGGIVTHSFRKNHLPLDKAKGSLPLILSLKSAFQNVKQNIMITIILIAVSFSSTFAFVMFYNSTIDTRTFAEVPGIELSNAMAIPKENVGTADFLNKVKGMNDVRKAQYLDDIGVKVDGKNVQVTVMDDFTQKETKLSYEGRYPLHDNEIAIAGYLAEITNKNIGDTVTVSYSGKQADYLITGLTQGSNMNGMVASIRHDGILKINSDFKQSALQIYLNKNVSVEDFLTKLNAQFGDITLATTNIDKEFATGMGAYSSIVSKLGIGMLVITIIVVILVLYFVISSSIIRRKRKLGIQKAIGFTTFQLMNEMSIGFLAPIIIGVAIGSFLGIIGTNPIMSVTSKSMGVMRANYIIIPALIALIGAAIVLISYTTSMVITFRIRKISAYALVSE